MGETTVGTNPDCDNGKCISPILKRSVSRVIVHEDYDPSSQFANDIALVRVSESIPLFSEDPSISSVIPICLPWKENDPGRNLKEGDSLVFTGWGRTIGRNNLNQRQKLIRDKVNSKHLQAIELPYFPNENENCSKFKLTNLQICAGGEKGW